MTRLLTPQALDAERAVLGGVLLEPALLVEVRGRLAAEDFARDAHAQLWRWICAEADAGRAADALLLADYLVALDAGAGCLPGDRHAPSARFGGVAYATGLPGSCPLTGNLGAYADRVRTAALRRRVLLLAEQLTDRARGTEDLAVILAEAEAALRGASDSATSGSGWTDAATIAGEVLDAIDADVAARARGEALALPTGIAALDEAIGGLRAPDLVVIGGRPGMGKTGMALDLALAAGFHGGRVGFVSREMGRRQLGERLLSKLSGIGFAPAIRDRRLDLRQRDRLERAAADLRSLPLWVEERASTAEAVRAASTRLYARHGLNLLLIDYAQRVRGRGETSAEQIGAVAQTAKSLALDLGICVVLLSQINRDGDGREPSLAELKGSGDLEQDADWVIAPWRPHVVRPEEPPDEAYLLLLKARHGQAGARIPVTWDGPTMSYRNGPSQASRRRL